MKRRSFLFGGGLLGLLGAAGAAIIKASIPESKVAICKDHHEPVDDYIKTPAISISASKEDRNRSLVPCKHCNVLFGIKI